MIRFRSECSTTTWATCPSQSPVNALYLAVVHPKKYLHARTLNDRGLSKWDRGSRFHVNSAIVRAERPSSYNPVTRRQKEPAQSCHGPTTQHSPRVRAVSAQPASL